MKKIAFIVVFVLFCVVGCFFSSRNDAGINNRTTIDTAEFKPTIEATEDAKEETKSIAKKHDEIPPDAVVRIRDEFKGKTKVEYAGKRTKRRNWLTASYVIEEYDSFGEKLSKPRVTDFLFSMVVSHNGTHRVECVIFVIGEKHYTLKPNFTQPNVKGKVSILINKNMDNRDFFRDFTRADSARARVYFYDGEETFDVDKEDIEIIRIMYQSFIRDGNI